MEDALILERAGCYAVVLEAIPERVAELISKRLNIPTIGIGAGAHCDGQVLVTHDLLGLFDRFTPRFAKQYANLQSQMMQAFRDYVADVTSHRFPSAEHCYPIREEELRALLESLEEQTVPPTA